jgi:hypothetical protein
MPDFTVRIRVNQDGQPESVSLGQTATGGGMTSAARQETKKVADITRAIETGMSGLREVSQTLQNVSISGTGAAAQQAGMGMLGRGMSSAGAAMMMSGNVAGGAVASIGGEIVSLLYKVLHELEIMPKESAATHVKQIATRYALAGRPLSDDQIQKLLRRMLSVTKEIQYQEMRVAAATGNKAAAAFMRGEGAFGVTLGKLENIGDYFLNLYGFRKRNIGAFGEDVQRANAGR